LAAKFRAGLDETASGEDMTFKPMFNEFDRRVIKFRNAEYAVSVGLPIEDLLETAKGLSRQTTAQ
jgi:hypothetical protein